MTIKKVLHGCGSSGQVPATDNAERGFETQKRPHFISVGRVSISQMLSLIKSVGVGKHSSSEKNLPQPGCTLKRLHYKELPSMPVGLHFHGLDALSLS